MNGQSADHTGINKELVMPGTLSKVRLDEIEMQGIFFIREEEKLARDVFQVLKDKWGLTIFENISGSEQAHMDAVKTLIENYELDDPVVNNVVGESTNPTPQFLDQKTFQEIFSSDKEQGRADI